MKEELNFTNIGNKESQKELIKEIMDLDAKDGLYDTVNDTVNELDKLAEKTFKGDDATTFVQREIWKDGYRKAQETLYTEEQVREAMSMARKLSGVAYTNDEIIQSLKQLKKD
jgi:alcohol dehydrogenase class IV